MSEPGITNRLKVEFLLEKYVESLRSAGQSYTHQPAPTELHDRRQFAEQLMARWQGGCSQENLADSLKIEWSLLLASQLGGTEAEEIGRAFGNVCRAVGITTSLPPK